MGAVPPPEIQASPGSPHDITTWLVRLRYRGSFVAVRGRLDWVPGPSGLTWLPVVLLTGVVCFAAGFSRRWPWLLLAAIVGLVAVDALHAVSTELFRPGADLARTLQFLGNNFVSVIVWVCACVTIYALARRDRAAVYGVLFVAGMLGLVGGVTDLTYLWKSQLPSVGSDSLVRMEVATLLGLGAGLCAASALVLARTRATQPPERKVARVNRQLDHLIARASEKELHEIARMLDVEEEMNVTLSRLATRLASDDSQFDARSVAFVVLADDEQGVHRWILRNVDGAVQASRSDARADVEVRATFPTFLRLAFAAEPLDAAVRSGRCIVSGDAPLVEGLSRELVALH